MANPGNNDVQTQDISGCQPQAAATTALTNASTPTPLNSQELLRGRSAVAIAHNGALYRLQTTRQGKLILTK